MLKLMSIVLVVVAHSALSRSVESLAPFMQNRIIGGTSADKYEHPYQLSLRDNNRHICGASLISPKWAVTAAHCVVGKKASNFKIIAGTNSIGTIGLLKGISRSVIKLVVHEQYHHLSGHNDIAVLKLSRKLPNDLAIQPIEISTALPDSGTKVTVTGWGTTSVGGSMSNVLRSVIVPLVSLEECEAAYGIGAITGSMCCAGSEGKDACAGDSGGPLVFNKTQIGVVSWGYGCGEALYPGVYTNIPAASGWIKATIDKN